MIQHRCDWGLSELLVVHYADVVRNTIAGNAVIFCPIPLSYEQHADHKMVLQQNSPIFYWHTVSDKHFYHTISLV